MPTVGPLPKWEARDFRTHGMDELVDLAGLRSELDARRGQNDGFEAYWLVARERRSDSRYEAHDQSDARSLLRAITADPDGVLAWLRRYW